MKKLILIYFLLVIVSCDKYEQLSKYGCVMIIPSYTRVYIDISSFETGELISFAMKMALSDCKNITSYSFQINQINPSYYYEEDYWKELTTVVTNNSTCSGDGCIFYWQEIKKKEKNIFL